MKPVFGEASNEPIENQSLPFDLGFVMPDQFEKLVARVLRLSTDRGARVACDVRLPDPDSPCDLRQVDVLIEHGGLVTHVECRDRSRKQDVMWIEELIGRRESLRADFVIAVSASGFSSLAIQKADRYGIYLRSLSEISDEEIVSWGSRIKIRYQLLEYLCASFVLEGRKKISDENAAKCCRWLLHEGGFQSHLYEVSKRLDALAEGGYALPFEVPLFWGAGMPIPLAASSVDGIKFTGVVTRHSREDAVAGAIAFDSPNETEESMMIHSTRCNGAGLVRRRKKVRLFVDTTNIPVPVNHVLLGGFEFPSLPFDCDELMVLGGACNAWISSECRNGRKVDPSRLGRYG